MLLTMAPMLPTGFVSDGLFWVLQNQATLSNAAKASAVQD